MALHLKHFLSTPITIHSVMAGTASTRLSSLLIAMDQLVKSTLLPLERAVPSTLTIGDTAVKSHQIVQDAGPTLTVFAAAYGGTDCTAAVQAMINQQMQSLSLTADNATFGDPWFGMNKSFSIVAAYTGQVPFTDVVQEGSPYALKYRPHLNVLSAAWGLNDVTTTVQNLVSQRALHMQATNDALGVDGWPGINKSLVVTYQYEAEQPQVILAVESGTLSIDYSQQTRYQPPLDAGYLNIISATYGQAVVTPKVVQSISPDHQSLDLVASNDVFGDSWVGMNKSFVLTYSFGPSPPQMLIVAESGTAQVAQERPSVTTGLVPLTGVVATGDIVAVQSGTGQYLAVSSSNQILANSASLGPSSEFVVKCIPDSKDQISLSYGTGNVVVGADGTLSVSSSIQASLFVLSLTTRGTLLLSVVGADKTFVSLRANDGAIIAGGSNELTFDTTFGLVLKPTEQGLQNHKDKLKLGAPMPENGSKEALLMKLVWDLTGGMFLAIGLGPLLNGSLAIQPGVYSLITSNPRTAAALKTIVDTNGSHVGETIAVGALLTFMVSVWDAGLLWPIVRFVLSNTSWIAIGTILTEVLVYLVPAGQAAQAMRLVLAFGQWAYTTTMDAIAYINAGDPAVGKLTSLHAPSNSTF